MYNVITIEHIAVYGPHCNAGDFNTCTWCSATVTYFHRGTAIASHLH